MLNGLLLFLIGDDGKTAYNLRWSRDYDGSLCMFEEWIDAKLVAHEQNGEGPQKSRSMVHWSVPWEER